MAVLPTGIGPVTGYNIERSLRFNSADSAYLNRTFSSGSRTTWTLSMWLKRSAFNAAAARDLFTVNNGTTDATYFVIAIRETDKLRIEGYNTIFRETTQVLRDVSAWYHLVVTLDTTNGTAGNRIKMYLNGVEITAFSTSNNPTSSQSLGVNQAASHRIGALTSTYFDGYMTEVNFIDGQALTPSSFGETDSATGVWKPKAYSGTYGTNGFFLKFADNSGTTSTTLGKDSSGNGNNWTPNNFSVTAGAGNDSLVDSPTAYGTDTGVGGEVRGNYATVSPIGYRTTTPTPTITNGNLDVVCPSGSTSSIGTSTFGVSSGKWYWEVTKTGTAYGNTGVVLTPFNMAASSSLDLGGLSNEYVYVNSGSKFNNNSSSAYGASWTNNDVIGVALDLDAGTLVFYKNGSSQGTAFSSLPSGIYLVGGYDSFNGSGFVFNFGQRAFAYTAPSGFKALCTTNLPTPTIGATSTTQAANYFAATTWVSAGGTETITNTVNGVSCAPDWVWMKNRTISQNNYLVDGNRGISKVLVSNTTSAEVTDATFVTALNSNGFSLGAGGFAATQSIVAWQWNAGGSNATNTAGTITSTVRANTTAGFSIATWTGQTSGSATIGHGLGVAPSVVLVKGRNDPGQWWMYHSAMGNTQYIWLNNTSGSQTGSGTNAFANTAPTSTVFTVGTSFASSSPIVDWVAYCFAPVAGYSAFGSYTGNGSTDGPFVYTGFRPKFVLCKPSSAVNNWSIYDTSRSTYNLSSVVLFPDLSNAETSSTGMDILSNGFKFRGGNDNANGTTYIFAAFAESPFKYSLAR